MDALARTARDALSVEEALAALHAKGASPVQTIRALREGRGISIREGKLALHRSPAWYVEAKPAEQLHDMLCDAFGDEAI